MMERLIEPKTSRVHGQAGHSTCLYVTSQTKTDLVLSVKTSSHVPLRQAASESFSLVGTSPVCVKIIDFPCAYHQIVAGWIETKVTDRAHLKLTVC
jgi:hypothetical protein